MVMITACGVAPIDALSRLPSARTGRWYSCHCDLVNGSCCLRGRGVQREWASLTKAFIPPSRAPYAPESGCRVWIEHAQSLVGKPPRGPPSELRDPMGWPSGPLPYSGSVGLFMFRGHALVEQPNRVRD
jgi:hypothetical protein